MLRSKATVCAKKNSALTSLWRLGGPCRHHQGPSGIDPKVKRNHLSKKKFWPWLAFDSLEADGGSWRGQTPSGTIGDRCSGQKEPFEPKKAISGFFRKSGFPGSGSGFPDLRPWRCDRGAERSLKPKFQTSSCYSSRDRPFENDNYILDYFLSIFSLGAETTRQLPELCT